ncbi:MAG: radical SAM protein [Nitrospina sp.]|nr:radical SAM protein [Nitrospina sp.]
MQTKSDPTTTSSCSSNEKMRSKRPLSINNSLCHGICNYNCVKCGVNKKTYHGPKEFQSARVTAQLIRRIKEAAHEGVAFRIIANSGDGEPTMHPEFAERMDMFGNMVREWDAPVPVPELSIVTNGSKLNDARVIDALVRNPITVNISFPTSHPDHYGDIMFGDADKGVKALPGVLDGIKNLMTLQAQGKINRICFHISPPERAVIREDFDDTVDTLTRMAKAAGLDAVELVMFPGTSNRSGLIRNEITTSDFYPDLFKKYDQKLFNTVEVRMATVMKRFFRKTSELIDLIRAYDYPCIWNGNFFIAPDGSSICCNDQSVKNTFGNIMTQGLQSLMCRKESYLPNAACRGCDQQLHRMKGGLPIRIFKLLGSIRLFAARKKYSTFISSKVRDGRILTGFSVLATVLLGYFHHPLWFLPTIVTAIGLIVSGVTGHSFVKSIMTKIGFPGEQNLGQADAVGKFHGWSEDQLDEDEESRELRAIELREKLKELQTAPLMKGDK